MKLPFKVVISVFVALFGSVLLAQDVQQVTVERKGQYANIDVEASNAAAKILILGDEDEREATIAAVMQEPNRFNPTALYMLAQALYDMDRREEAVYWLLVGEIRARIDATICAEASARQGVSVLRQSVKRDLMLYMVENAEENVETLDRAIAYIREHDAEYDRRWINLHGMGVFIAGMAEDGDSASQEELSAPEDTWPQLKAEALEGYREGYMKMVDKD